MLVVSRESATLLVALGAGEHDDQVDQVPDTEAGEGDQFEQTGANLAEVKPVDPEKPEEPGEEPGGEERLLRWGAGAFEVKSKCVV